MPIGADPVTNAAAYYGANQAFGGGGNSLSPGQRRQNELSDINRYLLSSGELTPEERDILTADMSNGRLEQLTPEQRLARYRTYNQSQNQGFRQQVDALSRTNDKVLQYGYDTFRSTFGREPTATEWSQLVPYLGGAEGKERGAAYIAATYDQYKQSPEYLKTQAGQYADDLDPLFDQYLGRDASASENDFFGQQLAGGRSAYEIEQLLQQLPEYQEKKDKQFRSGLASELEGYDQSFFNKGQDSIRGRSAKAGAGIGQSTALDFALTKLMGDIAERRGQYLAGVSEKQYGGNKEAAREDYRATTNRYYDDQNYQRNRNAADLDYYRGRSDQDRDYERQKEDYFQMLGRSKQGQGTLHSGDWINMGLQGVNAGVNAYGAVNPYGYLNR